MKKLILTGTAIAMLAVPAASMASGAREPRWVRPRDLRTQRSLPLSREPGGPGRAPVWVPRVVHSASATQPVRR
jgi:hypothetical protein